MNNINQSSEVKTKNITLSLILGWIIGIIFSITGLSTLFVKPLAGLIYILIACIALPPISKAIQKKLNINLSRGVKIILIIILFIFGAMSLSSDSPKDVAIVKTDSSTLLDTKKVQNVASSTDKVATNVVKESTSTDTKAITVKSDKENAQKELDTIIALGKKAGLITSYEFSDMASVVYVGRIWYTQTVSFKKDFLAEIASLKESITGYRHFEVRDAYSDEKVGEVTAFMGSLEVYK